MQYMEDLHFHIRDGIYNEQELQKFIDNGKKNGINRFCMLEHGNRLSPKHFGYLDSFETIDKMNESISSIKKNNEDVEILSGIEIDYSNDLNFRNRTFQLINYGCFDIVIGGIHGLKVVDGTEYFECILDMINNYPINIIAHIKLRDDWKNFKHIIEKIIKSASSKNIKIEINTSDRSIWNDEQFDFMMDMILEYNCPYSCGSDAHHSSEMGTNYDVLEYRLKRRGLL